MDVIEQLKGMAAIAPPSNDVLDRARAVIEATVDDEVATATQSSGPPRLLAAAAAAIVLAGGGSLAAWRLTRNVDPSASTTIECGTDTYIPVETANPVLACYASLSRTESPVPPLTGWMTPTGLVAVLPSDVAPPPGSKRLPASFQVDAGVRYVTDSLGDTVGPLATGCLTSPFAVAYAEGQLALGGLTGWQVQVSSAASGSCPAYAPVLDPMKRLVTLVQGVGGQLDQSNAEVRLDEVLHHELADPGATCRSTEDAVRLATADASALGITSNALTVSDGGAVGTGSNCAVAFVEPAGFVDVVVWQVPRS